jgi:hypothetical protein
MWEKLPIWEKLSTWEKLSMGKEARVLEKPRVMEKGRRPAERRMASPEAHMASAAETIRARRARQNGDGQQCRGKGLRHDRSS